MTNEEFLNVLNQIWDESDLDDVVSDEEIEESETGDARNWLEDLYDELEDELL